MNSKQRRKAYRKSPYQIETIWSFRGARVTITRIASPTAVIVEFPEVGARTHVPTRALQPYGHGGGIKAVGICISHGESVDQTRCQGS